MSKIKVMGSSQLQTSTANMEIIPPAPEGWNVGYHFKRFIFLNDQDCTVRINGSDPIFLRAGQGFVFNDVDSGKDTIYSFVIIEPDIAFNWIGVL